MPRMTPIRPRYRLRQIGTAYVLTVPSAITGGVGQDAPDVSGAEFEPFVRGGSPTGTPLLCFRPANPAARRLLLEHLHTGPDITAAGEGQAPISGTKREGPDHG